MRSDKDERVKLAEQRFEQCLAGNCHDAHMLAASLYNEHGLLPRLRNKLKKTHGAVTEQAIHDKVRGFLRTQSMEYLTLCRQGKDQLPMLYDSLRNSSIYIAFFSRYGANCLMPGMAKFSRLSQDELGWARRQAFEELGVTAAELESEVRSFGRAYVDQCRSKVDPYAVDGLILLGASCGLDIEEAGSNVEEFRSWQHQAWLKVVTDCLAYLQSMSLDQLFMDRKKMDEVMRNLNDIIYFEAEGPLPIDEAMDEWHTRIVYAPSQVGLNVTDVEFLMHIQYAYELNG
jgi:hypothetical protein